MFFLKSSWRFFQIKRWLFLPCVWCKGLKDCMREIKKKVELVWLKQIPHFFCGVGSRLGKTHTNTKISFFKVVGPLRGEGVGPPGQLSLKPQLFSSSKEKICWKNMNHQGYPDLSGSALKKTFFVSSLSLNWLLLSNSYLLPYSQLATEVQLYCASVANCDLGCTIVNSDSIELSFLRKPIYTYT